VVNQKKLSKKVSFLSFFALYCYYLQLKKYHQSAIGSLARYVLPMQGQELNSNTGVVEVSERFETQSVKYHNTTVKSE
jgi:hypothetical protein